MTQLLFLYLLLFPIKIHNYISLEFTRKFPLNFRSEKNVIEELTISGKLNGTDFRFLREMAGRDRFGNVTNGKLKTLSLSNARIVSGGNYYLETGNLNLSVTENNTIPKYVFHDCILSNIYLPLNLSVISWAFLYIASTSSLIKNL